MLDFLLLLRDRHLSLKGFIRSEMHESLNKSYQTPVEPAEAQKGCAKLIEFLIPPVLLHITLLQQKEIMCSMLQVQFRLIRETGGARKLVALRDLNPGELIFSEATKDLNWKSSWIIEDLN